MMWVERVLRHALVLLLQGMENAAREESRVDLSATPRTARLSEEMQRAATLSCDPTDQAIADAAMDNPEIFPQGYAEELRALNNFNAEVISLLVSSMK